MRPSPPPEGRGGRGSREALRMQETGPESGPTQPAIRVILMPKDTNAVGTIFAGIILSYINQADSAETHRHGPGRLVSISVLEVVFPSPLVVRDLFRFLTQSLQLVRTPMTG